MGALDVANNYFDAWNRRDPDSVVATFAEGGTYDDPTTGGPLSGPAIGDYISSQLSVFPDLSFEVVSAAPASDGTVAAEWIMKGTNSGSFAGSPPTGKSVALPGADFITVTGDKIASVKGYFDQRTLVDQLGLQVIVQPYSIGPFTFGSSIRFTTGKTTKPGALSLTWIEVNSEEEANEVKERSQQISQEMMGMQGFISSAVMSVGLRLITTTAWEDSETPKRMLAGGAHKGAMDRFFGPDFAAAATTTVWVPERFNGIWVRCHGCGTMANYDVREGTCNCGQKLPEHPPYW